MAAAFLRWDMSCVVLSCSGSTSLPNVGLCSCNLSCTVAVASSHAFQTCWLALKYSSMASLLSLYSHSCGSGLVVHLLLYTKCCMASRGKFTASCNMYRYYPWSFRRAPKTPIFNWNINPWIMDSYFYCTGCFLYPYLADHFLNICLSKFDSYSQLQTRNYFQVFCFSCSCVD